MQLETVNDDGISVNQEKEQEQEKEKEKEKMKKIEQKIEQKIEMEEEKEKKKNSKKNTEKKTEIQENEVNEMEEKTIEFQEKNEYFEMLDKIISSGNVTFVSCILMFLCEKDWNCVSRVCKKLRDNIICLPILHQLKIEYYMKCGEMIVDIQNKLPILLEQEFENDNIVNILDMQNIQNIQNIQNVQNVQNTQITQITQRDREKNEQVRQMTQLAQITQMTQAHVGHVGQEDRQNGQSGQNENDKKMKNIVRQQLMWNLDSHDSSFKNKLFNQHSQFLSFNKWYKKEKSLLLLTNKKKYWNDSDSVESGIVDVLFKSNNVMIIRLRSTLTYPIATNHKSKKIDTSWNSNSNSSNINNNNNNNSNNSNSNSNSSSSSNKNSNNNNTNNSNNSKKKKNENKNKSKKDIDKNWSDSDCDDDDDIDSDSDSESESDDLSLNDLAITRFDGGFNGGGKRNILCPYELWTRMKQNGIKYIKTQIECI